MFGVGAVFFMRKPYRIGNVKELFDVIYACKDGFSYLKLSDEATEAPHIDGK